MVYVNRTVLSSVSVKMANFGINADLCTARKEEWKRKQEIVNENAASIRRICRRSDQPSLRNGGMIFSNVLFIVYGISCTRGQTYDLEVISGVYNHVHISRVITQPGWSLELVATLCWRAAKTAKQLSTVAFKLSVWSLSCHCCVTFSTQLSALAAYSTKKSAHKFHRLVGWF